MPVASAFPMNAIPGREGWGRTHVLARRELTASCEYGKQRGYDYDYTRNSVYERTAEDQYLGTRRATHSVHTVLGSSAQKPGGKKEPLRHHRMLLLSWRLAAPRVPRIRLSRSCGNSDSTRWSTTTITELVFGQHVRVQLWCMADMQTHALSLIHI